MAVGSFTCLPSGFSVQVSQTKQSLPPLQYSHRRHSGGESSMFAENITHTTSREIFTAPATRSRAQLPSVTWDMEPMKRREGKMRGSKGGSSEEG